MKHREIQLRYAGLCGLLLLALAGVAWISGPAASPLWEAIGAAPIAFVGTFLFNRFQRSPQNEARADAHGAASAQEVRLSRAMCIATVLIALLTAAVAIWAPEKIVGLLWVGAFLGGAAGIHLSAAT